MKLFAYWTLFCLAAVTASGCTGDDARITEEDSIPFAGIAPEETITIGGTEPFWGAVIAGDQLRYTTPDNIGGTAITVRRFAGMNGLGYSGTLNGRPFDLAITPGECSDGMSDRTFPYHATLRLGQETRNGCAHTGTQPFVGGEPS